MTIGNRIKQRRKELGLSQSELAKRLDYKTPSAISKVETVEQNLTTDRIREFAKALDTTPEYLMGWEPLSAQAFQVELSDLVESMKRDEDVDYFLSDEEKNLVMEWRSIDDQSKEMIKRILAYGQKLRGEKDDD